MGVLPGADAAASSGVHGRRVFGYDLKETGLAFAFLAPSLVIFGVFFYFPFARLVSWGFYESRQRGDLPERGVQSLRRRADLL